MQVSPRGTLQIVDSFLQFVALALLKHFVRRKLNN